jgi:hypothetical protein
MPADLIPVHSLWVTTVSSVDVADSSERESQLSVCVLMGIAVVMPVFDRLELARNYLEQPSRPIEIISLCRGHSIAHFMI